MYTQNETLIIKYVCLSVCPQPRTPRLQINYDIGVRRFHTLEWNDIDGIIVNLLNNNPVEYFLCDTYKDITCF